MYAITGITGQVGGAVARALLAAGHPVRAVLRDAAKAAPWAAQGCEIATADLADVPALTRAFTGASAVFFLLPPVFDPSPGFTETRATLAAVRAALINAHAATPDLRVLCLSTIGAQATQENLLSQLGLMERELGSLPMPVGFLRPAWFMQNCTWDVAPARAGLIHSHLQPLDQPVPMVATQDVGAYAAQLLTRPWGDARLWQLEGPQRVSPNEVAAAFSLALGREVRVQAVPRAQWEAEFRAQGMRNPQPRMRMLDGFNEGWIAFDGSAGEPARGTTSLQAVVAQLVAGQ